MIYSRSTIKQLLFIFIVLSCLVGISGMSHTASASTIIEVPVGCTREWYIPHTVAASILHLDEIVLYQALEKGLSIADVAAELQIDVQLIINALVDIEGELVHDMHQSGCLTDVEAATWLTQLPEKMQQFVEERQGVDDATQPLENVVFLPLLMR